jgi:hypothetical protein
MTRVDTGSRTEADAAAFERHFASEPYDDRPSASDFPREIPAHQCWRNGGVECRACELEEQAEEAALLAEDDGAGPAT